MKRKFYLAMLSIMLFGFTELICAQGFTSQNGKIDYVRDNVCWAGFDADPGDVTITSSTLLLDEKAVRKLAKFLSKKEKKAMKWAQTARQEGVKNFCKSLDSDMKIRVESFLYVKDNKFYGNETHKDLFLKFIFFQVNDNSECYIWIPCDAGSQEIPIDNIVQSTTSVSSSGPLIAASKSTTREIEIHHVGLLKIQVRVNDIGAFVNHLNQLADEMKNVSKGEMKTNKLFK